LARAICDTEGGEREERWKKVTKMRVMVKKLLVTVRCHLDGEDGQLADSPLALILIVGTSVAWLALIALAGTSMIEPLLKLLG
jgi:hypothetical protein